MSELKPFEVIMLINPIAGQNGKSEIVMQAERVTELVRCEDCKHWNGETHGCNRNPCVEPRWKTDFCNYGEQKDSAEPIKHGRWIKNEDRSGWHCSCCGRDNLYAYPYAENNECELQDFYCPNCGAKMGGGEK